MAVAYEAREARVVSILFDQNEGWTHARAKKWIAKHGYDPIGSTVTADFVHYDVARRRRGARTRTIPFGDKGIEARVEFTGPARRVRTA